MRLAVLRSFPWRIVYLVGAALLLLALAIFGSSGNSKQVQNNKEPIPSKFQEENQASQVSSLQSNTDGEEGNNNDSQESTSTKVHVSVSSNTTNGETTGQASVEVTQDGQTQIFTQDISDVVDGNNFRIKVNNGKVDFDVDFDQHTKNKSSIEQEVEIEQESD
ncbi:MAG: hypothetical protein A2126_02770 [Candidatus Woykebacteria bacterium GWB1_45_5]|uniref:Uncharacterized protein n=2 Tax=Candidatus Woykeibacteriota TaxID=1817899 RepID=A0A1G1VZV4_9BACT|nr:MAG: hypothetical protein A2113_01410 [Candidatus Woykebacteria bacterium GWA1_44_8]OGY24742.1 MAG: hypothetical protein A2126_02770 [Candidatus Woykebacteria bacterium GWB1_45_5]